MDSQLIEQARSIAQEFGKCSAGLFQRRLRVSYATAVELQDLLRESDELERKGSNPDSVVHCFNADQRRTQGGTPEPIKSHQQRGETLNDHAFLPPSSASSWLKCAMWATMNARFPQEQESAEGIEGTAAHWVAWEILSCRPVSVGDRTPNGQIVTEEMIEGGELVKDTVRARMPNGGLPPFGFQIEQKLPIHAISPDVFGTPDLWALPSTVHIEIFDYKFGHRFVDEFWNPQGLCYLSGIVDLLSTMKIITPDMSYFDVSFTVIQPRCFYKGEPVRTHTYTLNSAREHWNKLAIAAQSARLPEPTATTNENCGDCPGRHACSALQLAAYADAEYSNKRTPLFLSPVAAALELRLLMRALDRIQARVDGLKEQTVTNIRRGEKVNYFRVEPGYGRQIWTIPEQQVISMGKLFGADLAKPGVLTPKQAEKAGVDPGIVKANSLTPTTGFRLIAENPSDAPRTFAGYLMGPVECSKREG
jgi:hypothetical protein